MVRGLYTAWSGMLNEQKRLDVISNNLANSATTAYKKEGVTSQSFSDVLAIKINDGSEGFVQRNIGSMNLGVKIGETYVDYSQGNLRETGNTFDLALEGSGFFAISSTDKSGVEHIRYTRDGSFTLNKEGYMVTKDGDYVLDNNNRRIQVPTNIPSSSVTIDSLGEISANGRVYGRVGVTDFEDYQYLTKYGENMYETVDGATIKQSDGLVHQGYIETSNVNVINEMVQMITITRAYETGQKMIQTVDSSLDEAINKVGSLK